MDQINNQIPAELPQATQNKISQIWGDFLAFVKNPSNIAWASGVIAIVTSVFGFLMYHLQKISHCLESINPWLINLQNFVFLSQILSSN